jgi:glycosyltransferase involved in cell wall biosynthesis
MVGIICHKIELTRGFIMNDSAKLVTIGITCFNAEETIERALESAVNQDWTNCEIVLVDDCSTDESVQIANVFAYNHRHIRIIEREKNGGPAASRNTILQHAKGVFVAFFDDDDISFPCRVRSQIKRLMTFEEETNIRLVACYASGKRRYPNGYVKPMPALGSCGRVMNSIGVVSDYLLLYKKKRGFFYGAGVPACGLLARRSTFEEVGGFDESLRRVEDADFAIRLEMQGGAFTGTSQIAFEQYATNAPDKSPERNLDAEQKLVKKNKKYLQSHGDYYYALNWPKLRFFHFKKQYLSFLKSFFGIFIRYPLRSTFHLMRTGVARLIHERAMHKCN